MNGVVRLRVVDTSMDDCRRRIIRLPAGVMSSLGLTPGDPILLRSDGRVAAGVAWAFEPKVGADSTSVGVCRFMREALGVQLGDIVEVERAYAPVASEVLLARLDPRTPRDVAEKRVSQLLRGSPVAYGEVVVLGGGVPPVRVAVVSVKPGAPVVRVGESTRLVVAEEPACSRVAVSPPGVEPGVRVCLGGRVGGSLVLDVEPGGCCWVWRGSRVETLDLDALVSRLASAGVIASGLRSLESGSSELQGLIGLLVYALWLGGRRRSGG